MPIFEIEAAGKLYEVEAPDSKSAAAAFGKMQSEKPGVIADTAKSLGVGIGEGAIGLAGAPADARNLLASGAKWAFDKLGMEKASGALSALQEIGGEGASSKNIKKKLVEPITGEFYKPQTTAGEYAHTVGQFLPSAALPIGGTAPMRIAGAISGGLGSEAAGQATKGTAAEPYARIAGGIAGSLAPSLVGRAVTPVRTSPERQRLVDILEQEGVDSLTAGQRTGNKSLQYLETFLGDGPGAGRSAERVMNEGQRQFTTAAMRRAGPGLNDASPESLLRNNDRLSAEFRNLSARNNLNPDNQFINDVVGAVRNYRRVPDSQQRAIVQGYVDDIIGHVNSGQMPGPMYQEMRSRLSRQANSLRQSDPTLSEALRDMRNALDGAMERSISPADQAAWQTARREYGAQKVIEKAASRAGEATAEGQLVPANLRNTVAAENRGAYARGQGDFSELARAGAGVMAPLPNSGTAHRNSIIAALSNLAILPATTVGGRAIMSDPVQAYLANQLIQNQPGREAIARALLQGGASPRLQYQSQQGQ